MSDNTIIWVAVLGSLGVIVLMLAPRALASYASVQNAQAAATNAQTTSSENASRQATAKQWEAAAPYGVFGPIGLAIGLAVNAPK